MNLQRRHLTPSQRAAVAVDVLPLLESEAHERKLATLRRGELTPVSQKVDDRGRSDQQASDLFSVNRQYIADAKRIKVDAPDLYADVRSGDKTITDAKREAINTLSGWLPHSPAKAGPLAFKPDWRYLTEGVPGAMLSAVDAVGEGGKTINALLAALAHPALAPSLSGLTGTSYPSGADLFGPVLSADVYATLMHGSAGRMAGVNTATLSQARMPTIINESVIQVLMDSAEIARHTSRQTLGELAGQLSSGVTS